MSDVISTSQLRFRRGNKTHGSYSADLSPEEAAEATRFEEELRATHGLDDPADRVLLKLAGRAWVFANRPVPDTERGSNVIASRMRLLADILDRLAVSRRERRKGDGDESAKQLQAAAVLAAIMKKPAPER